MKRTVYKLFILPIAAVLMLASCTSKSSFDKKAGELLNEMTDVYAYSVISTSMIQSAWRKAIFDHEGPDGRYCYDFNDAIAQQKRILQGADVFKNIEEGTQKMNMLVQAIRKCPGSRKEAYNEIVGLVTDINMYADMATDPSGSLQSYGNETRELESTIDRKLKEFKIKYPETWVAMADFASQKAKIEDD